VVGQDLGQFEAVYPKSWESFIGNAEAVQFMAITHPGTVDWLVKRLGEHVVLKRRRRGGQVQEYEERPVRDANQLGRILSKEHKTQIIWRGNKRPMLLKITPYFEYMPWWYYAKDMRFREKLKRAVWRAW
jgi:type IV secretory pathway TraG/TraD family ATPase VirD4